MQISENWLREWINPGVGSAILSDQLTMAGLEVKGLQAVAPELSFVVVAEVLSVVSHPDADKLSLCQVNDGAETVQVICGANNVRPGLKVILARVGAQLPDMTIKKAKIRSIESNGMLCSASELKLSAASGDILELPADAPPGVNITDYLQLDDQIIEIDLTPNRGDCLSIAGVAREVSAINEQPFKAPGTAVVAESIDDTFPVELLSANACPRYLGRIIRNIDPGAATPVWMQEKLRRCGLRPISPVVDITNFVMMELGQPMHGFDFDKLEGGIWVRMASAGEKIRLLNQTELECRADTLVIADHDKAIALAGIMGGEETSVQPDTTNIYFEAAYFSPIEIAGKARSYGLHTDSSHRFERGVDPQLQNRAIQRATELLMQIAGGAAGPIIAASDDRHLPVQPRITLRYQRVKRLLGIEVTRAAITKILTNLQMQVIEQDEDWLVTAPSYRFDIRIEADLIEEIGRMTGYDNIPGTREAAHIRMDSFSETRINLNQIRDVLVEQGFYEALTYSFVSPKMQSILDPGRETLVLENPISSDMAVMRTSLLPGLLQALQHNINRQQSRIRLFESGLCFILGDDELMQTPRIAAVMTGNRSDEGVYSDATSVDFFDIKGVLESVSRLSTGRKFNFIKSGHPVLHPGQSADILSDNKKTGFVGALHPSVLKALGINQPTFVFEIDQNIILDAALPAFRELPRFPSIRRDISLSVAADIAVEALIECVYQVENDSLQEVFVFDIYTGGEVRNNRKSVALGLILQNFNRTLVDEDVDKLVNKVLKELESQHNAVLRDI